MNGDAQAAAGWIAFAVIVVWTLAWLGVGLLVGASL